MTRPFRTTLIDDLHDDAALLDRAMAPYASKDTIYLKNAAAERRGDIVVGTGDLGFQQSCYIEETGHFNAVEFIISYNQLFYYTLAASVRDGLIPELSNWDLADYWERQLPSVLISKLATRFRQPINSRAYRGVLTITDIEFRERSRPLIALQTAVEFSDDGIGSALGDVEIALINLPSKPR
ncbi:FcoT family thioesterase [Mycolicibacterium sp. HS_4_1]